MKIGHPSPPDLWNHDIGVVSPRRIQISKNLDTKIVETKDFGHCGLASAKRHGLDHLRANDGLWTRLDVTVGLWKFLEWLESLPCAMNLHNAVTVSQQRLGKRVAQLSAARMNEVCAALCFSLGAMRASCWGIPLLPVFP